MKRSVILHYHLFKNAGTSLDQVLQINFPDRWVTAEFPTKGQNNSELIKDWISNNPEARAFSTHTAFGPIPRLNDVDIISVLLLRNPIARIWSVYRFEKKQAINSWNATLAKQGNFAEYVSTRLAHTGDRQCRNFHTQRLASMVPGDRPELERALDALEQISVIGLVEDFSGMLAVLKTQVAPYYPDFSPKNTRVNETVSNDDIADFEDTVALLKEVNSDDLTLWNIVRERLSEASS